MPLGSIYGVGSDAIDERRIREKVFQIEDANYETLLSLIPPVRGGRWHTHHQLHSVRNCSKNGVAAEHESTRRGRSPLRLLQCRSR